jgi:hypothetical protein
LLLLGQGTAIAINGFNDNTFATRAAYRHWLLSDDGAKRFGAANHTSSPLCWLSAGEDVKVIGGHDDLQAFADTMLAEPRVAQTQAYQPPPVYAEYLDKVVIRAHANFWTKLVKPGTFFTGNERVQIVQVARAARICPQSLALSKAESFNSEVQRGRFRAAGKGGSIPGLGTTAAASAAPYAVGDATPCILPDVVIDVIHRTVTDAGRVADSDQYYEAVVKEMEEGAYLETIAIVAMLTQIDTLHYAVGWVLTQCPAFETADVAAFRPPKQLALGQECRPHVARVPTVPLNNAYVHCSPTPNCFA